LIICARGEAGDAVAIREHGHEGVRERLAFGTLHDAPEIRLPCGQQFVPLPTCRAISAALISIFRSWKSAGGSGAIDAIAFDRHGAAFCLTR
jgi:hypothetical protein